MQFTENRPGCAPKPATGAIYLSASSVGGPPFPAYFPQSGLISLTVVGREGNAVETSIIGREGALGLHSAFGKRRSSRVLLRDSRPWGRNASMRWNLCSKLHTWPATTELASALSFFSAARRHACNYFTLRSYWRSVRVPIVIKVGIFGCSAHRPRLDRFKIDSAAAPPGFL